MSRNVVLSAFCVAWLSAAALGDNYISEWYDDPNGAYEINQSEQSVTILAPGTYGFEAVDGEQLGDIDLIETDPNGIAGAVYLYVERDPNEGTGPGARDVKEINLSTAQSSEVSGLKIERDLGEFGHIVAGRISGDFIVGQDILHDMEIETLLGNVQCDGMGNFTVTGGPTARHTGSIFVTSAYAAHMDIRGSMDGTIYMVGGLSQAGRIDVSEDLLYLSIGPLAGEVVVGGHLGTADLHETTGLVEAETGSMYVWGHTGLWGTLRLRGDLPVGNCIQVLHDVNPDGRIEVGGNVIGLIWVDDVLGNIVTGNIVHGAKVHVHRQTHGTVHVCGTVDAGAEINLLQVLSGALVVDGNMHGNVVLGWLQPAVTNQVFVAPARSRITPGPAG